LSRMEPDKKKIKEYGKKLELMGKEIGKGVIGQKEVVDSALKSLLCNGHILLESVPGLAKTMMVRLMTQCIEGTSFQRIQFTPDLLPTDIVGTTIYEEDKGFYTQKGPIFANIVLADEINRASPKVQSAMLEGMEERKVTIGRQTYDLPRPFIVLATQNPIEQRGVYPLAIAQIDRFLFKVFVDYPKEEDEVIIVDRNMETVEMDAFGIKKVVNAREIMEMQQIVRTIYLSDEIKEYIVDIVNATRKPDKSIENTKYIKSGASPRATIFIAHAARATAMIDGRSYTVPEDVIAVVNQVLRHRVILNYEGKANRISTDLIINDIIDKIPIK